MSGAPTSLVGPWFCGCCFGSFALPRATCQGVSLPHILFVWKILWCGRLFYLRKDLAGRVLSSARCLELAMSLVWDCCPTCVSGFRGGNEELMKQKAHGTTEYPVQDSMPQRLHIVWQTVSDPPCECSTLFVEEVLRWDVDRGTADRPGKC